MTRGPLLSALLCVGLIAAVCNGAPSPVWQLDTDRFGLDAVGAWNPFGPPAQHPFFFIPENVQTSDIGSNVKVSSGGGKVTITSSPFSVSQVRSNSAINDHAKAGFLRTQAVWANATAGQRILRISTTMSARFSNTSTHPFGNLVTNDQDDFRLGVCGLAAADLTTGMTPNFMLTNRGIYAMYQVEDFLRPYTCRYHSFIQIKRVGSRKPGDFHNMAVEYDSVANSVSWYVESKLVLKILNLGFKISTKGLVTMLDYGGVPLPITRFNPVVGFSCFTCLDAVDYHRPQNDIGLVRVRGDYSPGSLLAPGATDYFSAGGYCPTVVAEDQLSFYMLPKAFLDEESVLRNRLWGQGGSLTVSRLVVETDSKPLSR